MMKIRMLSKKPFDPGKELIDRVKRLLLFRFQQVDLVLFLGILTFEGLLIFMETVVGKGAAFGNLPFPGILKCLGCRSLGLISFRQKMFVASNPKAIPSF
jgi:hypothetical protein